MLIYRFVMVLALPVVLLVLLARRSPHLAERLGFGPPAPPRPTVWLHGASNGEITSARWVLEALLAARPAMQVLITCNTQTARAMVQGWQLPRVSAALAPLDSAGAAGRVMRRWRPHALIIVENELWPARIATAHRQNIPVLVIGARMSPRAFGRWQRLRGIMAQTLARISWASAQDQGSLDMLLDLGLPPHAAGPVIALKSQTVAIYMQPPFLAPALRARTVLAASTHDGDDAMILDAFMVARSANRLDHLIIAPRHPRRSTAIAALIAARGFSLATRSKGEVPDAATAVHLADSLGEMDHWYAMAGITIIGGSFSTKGGHTPWEPAAHGSAIVHGPDTANFTDAFAALDGCGGAIAVRDGAGLATALIAMDGQKQAEMAAKATTALAPAAPDHRLIDAILGHLPHNL